MVYPVTALTTIFKERINRRILPHMKSSDYDNVAKVRFEMKLTMKNAEGGDRKRKVHTGPIDVGLKSGAYINKSFKIIDEEWTGIYRRFKSENFLKTYTKMF